jgi:hypothetical protein
MSWVGIIHPLWHKREGYSSATFLHAQMAHATQMGHATQIA